MQKENGHLCQPQRCSLRPIASYLSEPWFKAKAPAVNVKEARKRWQLEANVYTHFLPKARGLEPTEEGWYFSGPAPSRAKLSWGLQHTGAAGFQRLFVLAGDGGTGRSAVVGRLVILSDEGYRETARGMSWDQPTDESEGTDVSTVVVPALRPDSRQPVTIVLDALDESNEPVESPER